MRDCPAYTHPPSPHTHPGLCRAEGRREATQGRTQLPAACTAGADLNPLPESEGTLSASAERTRGCPGLLGVAGPGSRAGQAAHAKEGEGPEKPPKQAGAGGAGPAGAGASVTSPGGPPLSGAEGRPGAFLGPGGSSCTGGWREVPAANQGQAVLTVSSGSM